MRDSLELDVSGGVVRGGPVGQWPSGAPLDDCPRGGGGPPRVVMQRRVRAVIHSRTRTCSYAEKVVLSTDHVSAGPNTYVYAGVIHTRTRTCSYAEKVDRKLSKLSTD